MDSSFARAVAVVTAALAVVLVQAAPAAADTESLAPVKKSKRALTFNVSTVDPGQVQRAKLDVGGRSITQAAKRRFERPAQRRREIRRARRSLARGVSAARIESAAASGGALKLHKPSFVPDARLKLRLRDGGGGDCAIDPATLTAPGCAVAREDTGTGDPKELWGGVACESASRVQQLPGGDPHPTSTGEPQPDDVYRSLTALDGDDAWGERCELGLNEHRYGEGGDGTFALYHEGERKLTFASERYPEAGFDLMNPNWRTVLQMKQAQPSAAGGGGPMIEVQIRNGRLHLARDWEDVWETDAPANGVWARYAFDVTYSQDPAVGSIKLYVDLNGDGDALDPGEESPVLQGATLRPETTGGGDDGIAPGESIPSHLRAGIYQNPLIECPNGCTTELDNVQVAVPR